MIWFTSDLHLTHDRAFLYEPRGFESIQIHDETIIANINEVVAEQDELYILGDAIMGTNDAAIALLAQIRCKNIHIILGNHDTLRKIQQYQQLPNVVEIGYGLPLKYHKWHFFLSHYPSLVDNANERIVNLCGHTHTQDRWLHWSLGSIYHVELDAHNNFPVNIDTIIQDVKKRHMDESV